jgi:hypothetical protein
VDIILVDETRSAVVYHTTLDVDNDVSADRENSAPTFMIPSRTPCSSASPPQRHGEPGSHWLHQEFHAPASSFSNSHEPYNSVLSSPLIYPLVLAFIIIIPAFSQSQTISPALGIGGVIRLKEENGLVWDVTWSRHRLSTSSSTRSKDAP